MVHYKGTLKVSLLRAHGLRSGNMVTVKKPLCELYFKIYIGKQEWRSKGFQMDDAEPRFDESCLFTIDHDGNELVHIEGFIHYGNVEIQGLDAKPGEDRCICVFTNELTTCISHTGPHWYLFRRVGSFVSGGSKELPGEVSAEAQIACDWVPNLKDLEKKACKIRIPSSTALAPVTLPSPIDNTEHRSIISNKPVAVVIPPSDSTTLTNPNSKSRSSTSSTPPGSTAPTSTLTVPSDTRTSGMTSSTSTPSLSSIMTASPAESPQSAADPLTPDLSNSLRKISSTPAINTLPAQSAIPLTQSFHVYKPMEEVLKFPLPAEKDKRYPFPAIPPTPPVFTGATYGRIVDDTLYFNDLDFLEMFAGISKIMEVLVWGDLQINAIQVVYNIFGLRVPGPRRGTPTLSPSILTLAEGEHIVSVGVRKNESIITGLTIVTPLQTKIVGSLPNVEFGECSVCQIPRNHRVVGFHGGASPAALNNIGVLYQSLPGVIKK